MAPAADRSMGGQAIPTRCAAACPIVATCKQSWWNGVGRQTWEARPHTAALAIYPLCPTISWLARDLSRSRASPCPPAVDAAVQERGLLLGQIIISCAVQAVLLQSAPAKGPAGCSQTLSAPPAFWAHARVRAPSGLITLLPCFPENKP